MWISGDVVELTHLRVEQRFSPEPLSRIIDRLNQQFGTDWDDADRLVFDAAATDQQMQVTAANNTAENFLLVFGQRFQQALIRSSPRDELISVFTRRNVMRHDYT